MESQNAIRRSEFSKNLGQLKSVIDLQWLVQTVMWILVSVLSFLLIGYLLQKIMQVPFDPLLFYAALVALAVALTLIYQFKFKKQLETELVLLDQRFHLKALLRTAYEVHRARKQSFIADKLIQSATRSFHYIPLKQLYQHHYKRPLLIITICMLVFFLIYSLPAMVPHSLKSAIANLTGNSPHDEESENLKSFYKLENIPNPSKIQHSNEEFAQKDLEERVTELTKDAQKSDALSQQMTEEIKMLQNKLNETQNQIAKNLLSQINPDLARQLPSLEDILQNGINPQHLDQIEEELSNLFVEEIPSSLSEGMAALNRNQELNQMLEDSLAQGKEGMNQESPDDSEQTRNEGGASSNQEGTYPDSEYSDSRGNTRDGGLNEQSAQAGDEFQFFPGDGMGDLSPDGKGNQAGDLPSNGTRQTPSPTQRARDAISKIKGLTGQGEQSKVQVQTLTTIGATEVPTVSIKRSYEQDLETVFLKEKIPFYHQQLIKNYFLAIDDRKK